MFTLHPAIKNPAFWEDEHRSTNNEWRKLRTRVCVRDNYTCQFCGHHALKFMNAHHIGDVRDDSLANLITCCVACHAVFHAGFNCVVHNVAALTVSSISQIEIIRQTRQGVKEGRALADINKNLGLLDMTVVINQTRSVDSSNCLAYVWYYPLEVRMMYISLKRWQLPEA